MLSHQSIACAGDRSALSLLLSLLIVFLFFLALWWGRGRLLQSRGGRQELPRGPCQAEDYGDLGQGWICLL